MAFRTIEAKRRWERQYRRKRLRADPTYGITRHQRTRLKSQAVIDAAKRKPCADCRRTYPWYVMEFDHTRGVKARNINAGMGYYRLLDELAKCDVVCANCHATRTYKRRGRVGGWNMTKRQQRSANHIVAFLRGRKGE